MAAVRRGGDSSGADEGCSDATDGEEEDNAAVDWSRVDDGC